MSIDIPLLGMGKSARHGADDGKPHILPQAHGAGIGADDQVELHGAETGRACDFERMCAHGPCEPLALRPNGGDVAAIGHMRTWPGLVGAQIIRAGDPPRRLHHEGGFFRRQPIGEGFRPRHAAGHGIGLAGTENRFQNRPDAVRIRWLSLAYRIIHGHHPGAPAAAGQYLDAPGPAAHNMANKCGGAKMPQAIYTASAESFVGALGNLAAILAQAESRGDAASLPSARLAPDMFPLSTQVQLACFHAGNGTARLMGHEVPGRPVIQEADLAALQGIVAATIEKLSVLTAEDFAGAAERHIVMPLQPGMVLDIDGVNFLHRWLLPNFYFHYVTAYDILRHNGLPIGKKDYLSHLAGFMRQSV